MLHDFNLLVTTTRGNEAEACSEMWYLLGEIGDDAPNVDKTGISGLVTTKTSFPPLQAVKKLRTILQDRPFEFRYCLRIIPIQEVVDTDIKNIENKVGNLADKIEKDETFRVTVEKRHSSISRKDIIEAAAARIDRKVDLTNPSWIVLIEVVGGSTGISVLKPSDIMSVVKERTED